MEQLIKLRFPILTIQSTDGEVSLDYEETNAILLHRWLHRWLYNQVSNEESKSFKVKNKEELKKCLQEMIEDSELDDLAEWTRTVDRGGLIHIGSSTYTVFTEMKLVIQWYLSDKAAHDVHLPSAVDLIVKK